MELQIRGVCRGNGTSHVPRFISPVYDLPGVGKAVGKHRRFGGLAAGVCNKNGTAGIFDFNTIQYLVGARNLQLVVNLFESSNGI